SRPAQKQPPAPIRIATRTSGAASTARQASPMPCHISLSSAFRRSGLFSMMVATSPLISTCTLSVIVASPWSPSPCPLPLRGRGFPRPSPPSGARVPKTLSASGARVRKTLSPQGRGQGEGWSPVERPHHRGQARIVEVLLVGLIQPGAVEQPAVALHDLRVQVVVGRDHRVGVEHLVGDEVGHALP